MTSILVREHVAVAGTRLLTEKRGRLTTPLRIESATDRYLETIWEEVYFFPRPKRRQQQSSYAAPTSGCQETGRADRDLQPLDPPARDI